MAVTARRKNQKAGQSSNVMIIPASIDVGEESSIAACGPLILADPKGKIDEDVLLEILEEILPKLYQGEFK